MSLSTAWRRGLIVCSMAALVWIVVARVFGPSDVWDQTQPKTVSYTTDIVAHGRWILPIERGVAPATKPPLYNWLAAPAVKALGYSSEIAHKIPSLAALGICWLLVVRLGRALDTRHGGALGWLAGLAFAGNYTMFKLGYLARPDMLLTLWLVMAWISATSLLVRRWSYGIESEGVFPPWLLRAIFWISIAAAGLTKGPVLLVALGYAVIAARVIAGQWRGVNIMQWWWGIPFSFGVVALWVFGAWRADPVHVRDTLLWAEILGRMSGAGPEGSREGAISLLTGAGDMAWYYLLRFAPWSVLSIFTIVHLWKRDRVRDARRWREMETPQGAWLCGAALFVVIVIVVFTLSAGKRADYIAVTFAPGALLASWWMLNLKPHIALRHPALAPLAAAVVLGGLTVSNQLQLHLRKLDSAPPRDFGEQVESFILAAESAIARDPKPVRFWKIGDMHVQAFLGYSEPDDYASMRDWLKTAETSFWVVAGRRKEAPLTFADWLVKQGAPFSATPVVQTAELPWISGWRQQATLYLVEPQ